MAIKKFRLSFQNLANLVWFLCCVFYLPYDNSSICFEEVWQPTNLDLASHSPWKHLSQVLQLMLNLVMAMLKVKNLIQFVEKITIFAKSILSKERIKVIIYTCANLHSAPGTFSFLHLVPWHSSSALRFCINYSLLLNCLVFSKCLILVCLLAGLVVCNFACF